jgi:RimJ/RimL family protein N-acetyltransferase
VVALRPADERDIDAIDRGIADPDVVRWIGRPTMSAGDVLELNRSRWLDGTGPTFAICGADDRCVGHVWLNCDDGDHWSIGYWLLPEARGHGFATRAVGLVSAWAFRDLGLTELRLVTARANVSSRRVAERCAFKREGPSVQQSARRGGASSSSTFASAGLSIPPGSLDRGVLSYAHPACQDLTSP